MITVSEALTRVLALCPAMPCEFAPIDSASGRVLAKPVKASRDQPPFDASAMDGYAIRQQDMQPNARFTIIGEAQAGTEFPGKITQNSAVRIFTGGVVPKGADFILIQENTKRDGQIMHLTEMQTSGPFIRAKGSDFKIGDSIDAPRRLNASDIGLLASMNVAQVPVARKPVVAVISTGDELVLPGEIPAPSQIIASNSFALKAALENQGAKVRLLPLARDTRASLQQVFALIKDADLIVTIGGASVGDYDLIAPMAEELGLKLDFYKIAMRPGKPLIAGKRGAIPMLGLPGNPVSMLVCAQVFLCPMIDAMLGLPAKARRQQKFELANDLPENGAREHYMRARVDNGKCRVFDNQDSSMMSVLAQSNALLVRPAFDGALTAGDSVNCILI